MEVGRAGLKLFRRVLVEGIIRGRLLAVNHFLLTRTSVFQPLRAKFCNGSGIAGTMNAGPVSLK